MSLATTRSTVIAAGIALVGVMAAMQPVSSWPLSWNVAHAGAPATKCEKDSVERGQYPDVDIQVIDDYSATKKGQHKGRVRIEMDILMCKDAEVASVAKALTDNIKSHPKKAFNVIRANTGTESDAMTSRGMRLLIAAVDTVDSARTRGPVKFAGMYPDADIQVIDDHSASTRGKRHGLIRIEMEIMNVNPDSLPGLAQSLKTYLGSDPNRTLQAIIAATGMKTSGDTTGLHVLKAAVGVH